MENTYSAVGFSIIVEQEPKLITKENEDFREFFSDFERHLGNLEAALKKSGTTKKLAAELQKKGALQNLVGTFSGRNDKELAHMVEDLGLSLEVTQTVLKLFMQVQSAKNRFLRDFHKALVNKIVLLNNDTTTLDANQRQAAITIVSELSDHVEEQIKQQDIVDSHQQKLQQLDEYVAQKDILDQEQCQKISHLEARALQFIRAEEEHQQTVDLLEKQQGQMLQRVQALELAFKNHTSTRSVILRNLLPGAALLIGLVGLLASIR